MPRLRLWIAGALGLGLGVLALRWADQDLVPIDATALRQLAPAPPPPAPPLLPPPLPPDSPTTAVTLVDARTGAPQPDVSLIVRSDTGLHRSRTDADGAATIPAGPGTWQLAATRGGAPLALVDGDTWQLGDAPPPTLAIRVLAADDLAPPLEQPAPSPGPGALVGIVTHAGARVADLVVIPIFLGDYGPGHAVVRDRVPAPLSLPPRRFVGTGGQFRWDGLAPGGYAALVLAPGRGAGLVRATVGPDLAGNASLDLAAAASVSGPVVDQRGDVRVGALVRARRDGLPLAAVRTSADGTYVLPELPPGPIDLEVRQPGCIGDRVHLTLTAGQRTVRGLALGCDLPAPVVTPTDPFADPLADPPADDPSLDPSANASPAP